MVHSCFVIALGLLVLQGGTLDHVKIACLKHQQELSAVVVKGLAELDGEVNEQQCESDVEVSGDRLSDLESRGCLAERD